MTWEWLSDVLKVAVGILGAVVGYLIISRANAAEAAAGKSAGSSAAVRLRRAVRLRKLAESMYATSDEWMCSTVSTATERAAEFKQRAEAALREADELDPPPSPPGPDVAPGQLSLVKAAGSKEEL
jgi:hypothetical protein